MRNYTTEELLSKIELRGSIKFRDQAYTRTAALAQADDELQTVLFPLLISLRSKYAIASSDYAVTSETRYPIPANAYGRSLQNVVYVGADGKESELVFVDHDREMEGGSWENWARGFLGGRSGYYLSGDDVVLYPSAVPGWTLRLYYHRTPNRLALIEDCGQITAINPGTGVVTLGNLPTSWAIGTRLCAVAGLPGFTMRFEAQAVTAVGAGTVTLADVSDLTVGDWLALEGDSPIPQLPVEAHPLLAQATIVKIHESLGDARLVNSQAKYKEIRDLFVGANSPRVEQAPKMLSARRGLLGYI